MKIQLPTYLASTIKALRVFSNISQKYLAYKLGVKQSVVSDIERGVIKPCEPKLETIAEVMNLSVRDIHLLAKRTPEENIQLLINHLRETDAKAATRNDKKLFVSYFKDDRASFEETEQLNKELQL